MNSKTGSSSATAAPPLTAEAAAKLWEGISIVLSRWTTLQMAVLNEWGGPHSNFKSHQLGVGLFSLLTQSKKKAYIEDVEEFLRDAMDSLGVLMDDVSLQEIYQIALPMMEMHEGCQEGDFSFIQKLKARNPPKSAAYVMQDSDDDDDDDHEDSSMMIDDAPQPCSNVSRSNTVDESMPEAEEGWTVVAPRRNKGRRN